MSKLNITKKEIVGVTKGLKSKTGFKILTGKRSFGKVVILQELREKLYNLVNNNSYKSYSVKILDTNEVKEIINVNNLNKNNTKEIHKDEIENKKTDLELIKTVETVETKEVILNRFFLNIKEGNKIKPFEILAESEEEALYQATDVLQLWKGIEFIKNYKKSYLYSNFENLEKQLQEKCKCKCTMHEGIWLTKTKFTVSKTIKVAA